MPPPLLTRLRQAARDDGAVTTARACASWAAEYVRGLPALASDVDGTFAFGGEQVPYLRHRYNRSWLNERAVEVPLAQRTLTRRRGEVLEVGNVLSHYGTSGHTVVDRYERAPGVVNEDVADFVPGRALDLIVSVSTLEHVGFDEQPLDPDKPLRVVRMLADKLAPGGLLWATLPVGYNPALDDAVRAGRLPFTRIRALRRSGPGLSWRETDVETALEARYDQLLCAASAVLVCELEREPGGAPERR